MLQLEFRYFPLFIQDSEGLKSASYYVSDTMVNEPKDVQVIRDQPQTSQRATTNYADLDFSGDHPGPAPPLSLEKVTVGTKPVSLPVYTAYLYLRHFNA